MSRSVFSRILESIAQRFAQIIASSYFLLVDEQGNKPINASSI